MEQFTPFNPATRDAIVALGNGDTQTALLTLDAMITRQAYQIAFNEIFLGLGVIMLLQIVALMFARPPFAGQSPGTAK